MSERERVRVRRSREYGYQQHKAQQRRTEEKSHGPRGASFVYRTRNNTILNNNNNNNNNNDDDSERSDIFVVITNASWRRRIQRLRAVYMSESSGQLDVLTRCCAARALDICWYGNRSITHSYSFSCRFSLTHRDRRERETKRYRVLMMMLNVCVLISALRIAIRHIQQNGCERYCAIGRARWGHCIDDGVLVVCSGALDAHVELCQDNRDGCGRGADRIPAVHLRS